ncbi:MULTISPECIES: L-serine ammonia-lyase [Tenacibaculum]|uniref:L-serine dehydratase n=1 Tax=Tenacibaculum mesophilum TaxID=104268 RepID=A0AAE9SDR7_9FLAO|nr:MULTISPECIES: L-serine ammonia-lyase [Tenacibaculum]GFD76777.1 L-serine ammonia-lyase [Tenacibaculum sp. KUL113]GFD81898.1 L-serine ammonia-lyase [Tenacibaculum sp. KUL118]AZJ31336.1 L-serine ammonia-lyase [Tenacibaculum mesophilum]MCO7186571.1 L-serine ammonia-lyase [Tenacibaculum sp. XPcli2-G]QFS29384.1 L-serine ammonia-lyase [Tenacibaculum mesophilum]|eukprot:TRINITY_DN9867_c0_g1_i1.p1 TRINITY_DN9867_c0_g1~~TRINITY_DN9867_c0_g1_i1.p1  ORF type:complete len:475 (+),score=99.67 TRINITY_DN9867_c0_g1_i1:73-1497(+)
MSQFISVFDMLKIGVGPSSSHTLGPWRAAQQWIQKLKDTNEFLLIEEIKVDLYGSLSLTGKGHATDLAVLLGLSGADPEYIPIETIDVIINDIKTKELLFFNNERNIAFANGSVTFNKEFLPFHANGMTFRGYANGVEISTETYYSIGGGFIVQEDDNLAEDIEINKQNFPFPINRATELEAYCEKEELNISDIVYQNELVINSAEDIDKELHRIWNTMLECMYIGCHTQGILPGGLNVKRRAFETHQRLIKEAEYTNQQEWITAIRSTEVKFREILKWVSCLALSVNEVNASLGRVVTAPTNGSAGVIPAVIMYYLVIENHDATFEHVKKFLLVAGEIGSIFKKNATISAAMGGCQAEIGVSSAMAAAALTELLGGTPSQCLVAAEIAMEHHLGLTCDPIGGLVQVPCIERNAMGAIKAINAAELALETNPKESKVPLDKVVDTMWETAKDMNRNYKETSEGGLAVTVRLADC